MYFRWFPLYQLSFPHVASSNRWPLILLFSAFPFPSSLLLFIAFFVVRLLVLVLAPVPVLDVFSLTCLVRLADLCLRMLTVGCFHKYDESGRREEMEEAKLVQLESVTLDLLDGRTDQLPFELPAEVKLARRKE